MITFILLGLKAHEFRGRRKIDFSFQNRQTLIIIIRILCLTKFFLVSRSPRLHLETLHSPAANENKSACDPRLLLRLLSWVHIRDGFVAPPERDRLSNPGCVSGAQSVFFYIVIRDILFPTRANKEVADASGSSRVDFSVNFDKFESIRSSPAVTTTRLWVSIIPPRFHALRGSSVQEAMKLSIWNNVVSPCGLLRGTVISVVIIYSQLASCLLFGSGFITAGMSFCWIGVLGFIIIPAPLCTPFLSLFLARNKTWFVVFRFRSLPQLLTW